MVTDKPNAVKDAPTNNNGCFNKTFSLSVDNWWSLLDGDVFSRLVEMYKSIVVFLLTGGKALLIPVFLESYINATLKLLEKLHKVTSCACPLEFGTL